MRIKIMIAVLMVVISALACDSSAVSPTPGQDISGTYNVAGTNLEGTPYTGTAVITRTTGNDYDMTWDFGNETETGSGTFDGTTFDVTWETTDGESGTAIYTIQPDGSLVGTWKEPGLIGEGTETLTPQ
jgi:hypothetical protein